MTVDWKRAPKGATHFGPKTKTYEACWFKKSDGAWHFQKDGNGCSWHKMQNPPSRDRFGRMITINTPIKVRQDNG